MAIRSRGFHKRGINEADEGSLGCLYKTELLNSKAVSSLFTNYGMLAAGGQEVWKKCMIPYIGFIRSKRKGEVFLSFFLCCCCEDRSSEREKERKR